MFKWWDNTPLLQQKSNPFCDQDVGWLEGVLGIPGYWAYMKSMGVQGLLRPTGYLFGCSWPLARELVSISNGTTIGTTDTVDGLTVLRTVGGGITWTRGQPMSKPWARFARPLGRRAV